MASSNAAAALLHAALVNAGVPIQGVSLSAAGVFTVQYAPGATQQQQTQGNSIAAGYSTSNRVPRPLYAIYNDLAALTGAQQSAVWGDLSAGSPAKYLLDSGPNAAAVAVLDWVVKSAGVTGAALTAAELRATAMYCQDNPTYLVNPAFAPTVNVPGDQPG